MQGVNKTSELLKDLVDCIVVPVYLDICLNARLPPLHEKTPSSSVHRQPVSLRVLAYSLTAQVMGDLER